ncbi:MAG: haloacid dehalogenase-like hydrolase [Lachnospiraceae bacterium]|nr:haloacid dehalogenase-like hydrolase [Lachnospiraceae bacterium]
MRKKCFNMLARVICVCMIAVFLSLGFQVKAEESDNKDVVAKPRISISLSENSLTLTIKKTLNAKGYLVYGKAQGDEKYSLLANIEEDGTKTRKYTMALNTSISGTYKIRVKAYNGEIFSKYSKTKKINISPAISIDYDTVFPSWNKDSGSLKELVAFVSSCTDMSSTEYLDPAERIAVFDMDGTILCEKAPVYVDYCLTMYRVLDDPDYNATEEERDAMQQIRDHAYSEGKTFHPETLTKDDLVASAFAGMTPKEFRSYVVNFADNTDVVGFSGMTYGQSFYKPMIEVIEYLKANDFDVWMVSACEREVVRALVERYNIPYDHVIATDVPYVASGLGDKEADTYNMSKYETILLGAPLDPIECGKSGKSAAIAREIGRIPVLAFGNSSGDYSMLNYAEGNPEHTGMGFFIVCDDTVREYGDDEKAAEYYAEVEKQGWTSISMANDWKTIYGNGVEKTELPGAEDVLQDAA